MEAHDGDILLTSALLRLYEPGRAIDAYDEATGNFGIERAAVSCLFAPQNAPNPRNDLVRRGICGLIEVDVAVLDVLCKGSLEGRVAPPEWACSAQCGYSACQSF